MKRQVVYGAVVAMIVSSCGSVDPELITRPANSAVFEGDRAELVAAGATLWADADLGESGVACSSCHVGGAQFKETFKSAYPHEVAMVKSMSGITSTDAEQMVQFCMMAPMKSQPLACPPRNLSVCQFRRHFPDSDLRMPSKGRVSP